MNLQSAYQMLSLAKSNNIQTNEQEPIIKESCRQNYAVMIKDLSFDYDVYKACWYESDILSLINN